MRAGREWGVTAYWFPLRVMNLLQKQRKWLHDLVNILDVMELFPFKWCI